MDLRGSKTVVKKQGYEPPIHDFSIIRQEDGEDITEEVLNDEDYTFLLVAHQLNQADDSTIDLINELYDYSVENDYKFTALLRLPMKILKIGKNVPELNIRSV